MPKQSKFLLNVIGGVEDTAEEIRGKIQCISSGETFVFTSLKEMHDFILKEIRTPADGINLKNEESSIPDCPEDHCPTTNPTKELKQTD